MLENRSDDGRLSEASRDELLVVRAQLGDQSAWRELIDRWHPRLHRFVARMVDDVAASEDISQTVWLKVVRSLTSLRDTSNAGPWLYSIARKSVTDHLRRQYRRVPVEPVLEVADE
ncbi:MAG: sigma-70 family RNA polymerase sigma factor, partial [Planctomycetota bacterium]